jgi:microcystin degradation protein MlrC
MEMHGSTGAVTVVGRQRHRGFRGWPWIVAACSSAGDGPAIELSQGARSGVQSAQAELASQLQEAENVRVSHMQIIEEHIN